MAERGNPQGPAMIMATDIPAALASRLDELFSRTALAGASEVAKLLEISTTQLTRLGDQRRIVYRLKGTAWRFYAREDVERFIQSMSSENRQAETVRATDEKYLPAWQYAQLQR